MKILYYCLLSSLTFFFGCCQSGHAQTISILSTDLSLDRDPDDWFDTFLFLTIDGINPAGIILENYATDSVEDKTMEFTKILGCHNMPVLKGIQQPLKTNEGSIISSNYKNGAEFILETMEKAKGKVRLIAVGSLRNEALAYDTNPELFLKKIDKIYFAGGSLNGNKDTNVKRDTIATRIIVNSEAPVVWIPCTDEMKQKLSGKQEERIEGCSSEVCSFLTGLLSDWREYRGEEWLERTRQLKGQGKNLWSIPAFIHIAMRDNFNLKFVSGTMTFDNVNWTGFERYADGKDMMLTDLNQEEITEWLTHRINSNH